jgi:hypothetical protein
MKDYYDIWYLYKQRLFDSERLKRSVKATFTRRATPIPTNTPDGLTEEFAKDPERENMWRAFLVRSAATVDEGQSLWMTVEEIRPFLMDIAS